MPESSEKLYSEIWGESAPPRPKLETPPPASPEEQKSAAAPPPPPAPRPEPPAAQQIFEQYRPSEAPAEPQTQAQPRNSFQLQLQIVETLGQLESRVADIQRQLRAYSRSGLEDSLRAAEDISAGVSSAVSELDALIVQGREMVKELSEIQDQATRSLAAINERLA